jgi:phosphonate transport system substrate-binding protein
VFARGAASLLLCRDVSEALTFALVPMVDDPTTGTAIAAFCRTIERALGVEVQAKLARSPEELAAMFEQGTADFAWLSPTLLLTAPALARVVPIACTVREGATSYHSVIFARRDSGIRGPLDLRGKRMAWVAPSSASGYIFPRIALAGLGIDPTALFASETFHQSHDAVVGAVLDGRADAGAVFAVFEGGNASRPMKRSAFLTMGRGDEALVLLSSPPIASDLVVATSEAIARAPGLTTALFELGGIPGVATQIALAFNAESFAPVDRAGLDELRRQVQDARDLGVV